MQGRTWTTLAVVLAVFVTLPAAANTNSPAAPVTPYHPFGIWLRSSSASPQGPAFRDAIVRGFADAGLPHDLGPDGQFVPLALGDARPSVIERVDIFGAAIDIGQLSDAVCAATFAAMSGARAFVAPPDAETPTIMVMGAKGQPPPGYVIASVRFVSSPAELCAALKPAFDRWAARN